MLLLLSFLFFCLFSHFKIGGRYILPPFPFISITRNLFRNHKGFFFGALFAGFLHLGGTIFLGNIRYNTSGFDIFTHFLLGFFVREAFIKVNLYYPIIDWGKRLFGEKWFINATTFSVLFCLIQDLQEVIQQHIPILRGAVGPLNFWNDVRDTVMNLLGITFSLLKDLL